MSFIVAIGPSAALAQSGSAGGSIGNDEKSLSGSREAPRAVEPSKPARAQQAGRRCAAPRRANEAAVTVAAAISTAHGLVHAVGATCGTSTERLVITGGRIAGEAQFRSSQSKWLHDVRRIRLRFELEQFRPFLGPQRLRFIRAFRWMCRTLDRIKTVVANFGSYRVRRSAISQAIPFVCAVSRNA